MYLCVGVSVHAHECVSVFMDVFVCVLVCRCECGVCAYMSVGIRSAEKGTG